MTLGLLDWSDLVTSFEYDLIREFKRAGFPVKFDFRFVFCYQRVVNVSIHIAVLLSFIALILRYLSDTGKVSDDTLITSVKIMLYILLVVLILLFLISNSATHGYLDFESMLKEDMYGEFCKRECDKLTSEQLSFLSNIGVGVDSRNDDDTISLSKLDVFAALYGESGIHRK